MYSRLSEEDKNKKEVIRKISSLTNAHEWTEEVALGIRVDIMKKGSISGVENVKKGYRVATHETRAVLETEAYLLGGMDDEFVNAYYLKMRTGEYRRGMKYLSSFNKTKDLSNSSIYKEYVNQFRRGKLGEGFAIKENINNSTSNLAEALRNKTNLKTAMKNKGNPQTMGLTNEVLNSRRTNHTIIDSREKTKHLFKT